MACDVSEREREIAKGLVGIRIRVRIQCMEENWCLA